MQLGVGVGGLTVNWNDNASYDIGYVIYYWSAGSNVVFMVNLDGDQTTLGPRQATIPNLNPSAQTCVTLWAIELLPGWVTGTLYDNISDSSPTIPSTWRTSPVCGWGFGF